MTLLTIADTCTLWLSDVKSTRCAGVSLASTIYRTDITIGLVGDLGAGKTTFMQGFLEGLGVHDAVTSPTYALEQRYISNALTEILHIDLYRLAEGKADEFLHSSEDHTGIRCIEWIDRSTCKPDILITLEEKDEGRMLTVSFDDIPLPTESDILRWREEVALPAHIGEHCDAVASQIAEFGEDLLQRGIIVRPTALKLSALAHDLLRFVDFGKSSPHHYPDTPKQHQALWKTWNDTLGEEGHEKACQRFLEAQGFAELGSIIEVHGCKKSPSIKSTVEQKLLYYADKRVIFDTRCTLEERFADFAERYCNGEISEQQEIWHAEAKEIEKYLGFL